MNGFIASTYAVPVGKEPISFRLFDGIVPAGTAPPVFCVRPDLDGRLVADAHHVAAGGSLLLELFLFFFGCGLVRDRPGLAVRESHPPHGPFEGVRIEGHPKFFHDQLHDHVDLPGSCLEFVLLRAAVEQFIRRTLKIMPEPSASALAIKAPIQVSGMHSPGT